MRRGESLLVPFQLKKKQPITEMRTAVLRVVLEYPKVAAGKAFITIIIFGEVGKIEFGRVDGASSLQLLPPEDSLVAPSHPQI
jgi:hypothetical protein